LPVVVDFYSDGCGPCRQMAPIFKKVAQEFEGQAVFVKIDTNAQHELSSKYQIRSLPTFQTFIGGKKSNEQKGGIGEGPLRQMTQEAMRQAERENTLLELDQLVAFYQQVDPTKSQQDIQSVYSKCSGGANKAAKKCQGNVANTLIRKLKKKYKQGPETSKLFTGEDTASSAEDKEESTTTTEKPKQSSSGSSKPKKSSSPEKDKPNLQLATKEQLMEEIERRLDEERDALFEQETDEDEEAQDDHSAWGGRGEFPERVVIIGGGPAGMAAAIYAARAGLTPLVIAPSMGGQLQGKGVDVENYPGMHNVTGPAVIASMRMQAASFGAVFEEDMVISIDTTKRPLEVLLNATGAIATHSIILATGAESNWLGVPGEYELRGGGVSSCATCDGFLFAGKHVIVVGGGDAAMEDALVLARTSKSVTLVHRRDSFRASKILATRVMEHPLIDIQWNTVLEKIEGKALDDGKDDDSDEVDLDDEDSGPKYVTGVFLKDITTDEIQRRDCDAVFVAIGHTPTTKFLEGIVDFDPDHSGYLKIVDRSTRTSVPGIFAAGDVSDAVYRQAITSAGSGAAAALDAERYLSEEGLGNEAAELEAELMAEMMGMDRDEIHLSYNAYEDAGGRGNGIKESVGAEL
jgi:thioredoxin reductase (NADPH)